MHGHRGAMGRTRGEVGKRRDGDMGRRSGEEVCAIGREGKGERGKESKVVVMMEPRERRRPPADERCEAWRGRRVARART